MESFNLNDILYAIPQIESVPRFCDLILIVFKSHSLKFFII